MQTRGQYIPTTVYLDPTLSKRITVLALTTGKPKAEIVRAAVDAGLNLYEKQESQSARVLLELAALGKKLHIAGPRDLSTHHDHYLYDA